MHYLVRSHVERRCSNLGPTQNRTSPSILQYTKMNFVPSRIQIRCSFTLAFCMNYSEMGASSGQGGDHRAGNLDADNDRAQGCVQIGTRRGGGGHHQRGVRHSRNVGRFRGGLVFEAHRLLYHSTLGSRVIKKKKKTKSRQGQGVNVRPNL